jgi:hypothetical protein
MIVLSVITISFLTFGLNLSWSQEDSVGIIPPESKPSGLSYEDHVMNFWKLMLSIPIEQNPMEDETGEICTHGQNTSRSSVFYLTANAGGASVKTCEIPSGLSLLIPVITVTSSDEENPSATVDELHNIAQNDQDHVDSLYLRINGHEFPYEELLKYRLHTREFQVMFPENALDGAAPGPATVVADGYYVITEPLGPGEYNIQFKGSVVCLEVDCIEPTFATDNTFNLIVK